MEGIKLTNFTESKEIYDFLDRQFTSEFNMVINGKSIKPVKYMNLINLVLSVFKDYPSFRMYFTGYTDEEKESIAFILSTINIFDSNDIKTKITRNLSSEQLQNFCDCVFTEEIEDDTDFEPTYSVLSFKGIRIPYRPKGETFIRLNNRWKGTSWRPFGSLLLRKSDWENAKLGLLSKQKFGEDLKIWFCVRNGKEIDLYMEMLNRKGETVDIKIIEKNHF